MSKGRVALVTGGTRGIGRAISEYLRDAGRTVAANYGGNDAAAEQFTQETGIATYKFDVSNFDSVKEGIEKITKDLGPIEIVVNNAGITRDGTLHKMTFEQWDAVIQTNLTSCYNTCKCVIDSMRERGLGASSTLGPSMARLASMAR